MLLAILSRSGALGLLANVSVKPNPNALPGTSAIEKLIDGLAAFALLACVGGVLIGAAQWALGSKSGNYSHASDGTLEGDVRAARRLRDRRRGGDHQLLLQLRLGGALMWGREPRKRKVHLAVTVVAGLCAFGFGLLFARVTASGDQLQRLADGPGAEAQRGGRRGRLPALTGRGGGRGRLLPARLRHAGDPAAGRAAAADRGRRHPGLRGDDAGGQLAGGAADRRRARSGSASREGLQTLYASVPVGYRVESYSPARARILTWGFTLLGNAASVEPEAYFGLAHTDTGLDRRRLEDRLGSRRASGRRRRSRPAGARSVAMT